MVTFTCKRSGNTVSFQSEDDIASMRKHEGYTEVVENPPDWLNPTQEIPNETVQIQTHQETPSQAEVLKKRGRPKKDRS